MELESLVVPQADAAEEAGKLIEKLPELWGEATLTERRKLVLTMLDGVYIDAKGEKRVVAIKPKPAFRPVFQVATTKTGSDVVLIREEDPDKPNQPPSGGHEADGLSCSWWRRGRVELGREHSIEVASASYNDFGLNMFVSETFDAMANCDFETEFRIAIIGWQLFGASSSCNKGCCAFGVDVSLGTAETYFG